MEICLNIHTNSYCENQEYIEITPSLCMKTKPLYSTKQNKTLYSWLGEEKVSMHQVPGATITI